VFFIKESNAIMRVYGMNFHESVSFTKSMEVGLTAKSYRVWKKQIKKMNILLKKHDRCEMSLPAKIKKVSK